MKTLQKFGGFAALFLAVAYLIGWFSFSSFWTNPASPTRPKRWPCSSRNRWSSFQPTAHVCVLWRFFDCPVTGVVRPVEVRRNGYHAGGNRDWHYLGWLADCQWHGLECRDRPCRRALCQRPNQAALTWQGIESVANGLGYANGEILGGLLTLLVSLAALRAGGLPKGLNILGLLVGAVGIISIFPGLTGLIEVMA